MQYHPRHVVPLRPATVFTPRRFGGHGLNDMEMDQDAPAVGQPGSPSRSTPAPNGYHHFLDGHEQPPGLYPSYGHGPQPGTYPLPPRDMYRSHPSQPESLERGQPSSSETQLPTPPIRHAGQAPLPPSDPSDEQAGYPSRAASFVRSAPAPHESQLPTPPYDKEQRRMSRSNLPLPDLVGGGGPAPRTVSSLLNPSERS